MTTRITVEIDLEHLDRYHDDHLAQLWHLGQMNPAPLGDRDAEEVVRQLGDEIIRRWLKKAPQSTMNHRPGTYYWHWLTKLADYKPPGDHNHGPDFYRGEWVVNPDKAGKKPSEPSEGAAP